MRRRSGWNSRVGWLYKGFRGVPKTYIVMQVCWWIVWTSLSWYLTQRFQPEWANSCASEYDRQCAAAHEHCAAYAADPTGVPTVVQLPTPYPDLSEEPWWLGIDRLPEFTAIVVTGGTRAGARESRRRRAG